MSVAVHFHETGAPEVLKVEDEDLAPSWLVDHQPIRTGFDHS